MDLSRVGTEKEEREFEAEADPEEEMTRWIELRRKSGLRPQEGTGLMWRHVDLERGLLQVLQAVIEVDEERRGEFGKWVIGPPKTGPHTIALCPEAVERACSQVAAPSDALRSSSRVIGTVGRKTAGFPVGRRTGQETVLGEACSCRRASAAPTPPSPSCGTLRLGGLVPFLLCRVDVV